MMDMPRGRAFRGVLREQIRGYFFPGPSFLLKHASTVPIQFIYTEEIERGYGYA